MTTTATGTTGSATTEGDSDDGYGELLTALRVGFMRRAAAGGRAFTTDATGLFELFLEALPPEHRAHYRCSACRHFVERYGALVTIDEAGRTTTLLWRAEEAPPLFVEPVRAMERRVARARVNGVFLAEEHVWGTPTSTVKATGHVWRHLAVEAPGAWEFRPPVLRTCAQVMAEKREDFAMLVRGLDEFNVHLVRNAHLALTSGSLYRSEKAEGVARWLLDLHEARAAVKGAEAIANVTWRAVAEAPAGFCHVRSSMIGTLLEDLAAALPFGEVARRWADKMHPLQYQRPTAAPSDGNIAQAEKLIAALEAAGSLQRRFARLEDLETVWRPRPPAAEGTPAEGVFGHLKGGAGRPKPASVELPTVTMTWVKFAAEVLPSAEAIEFEVPAGNANFGTYVTAADPNAPPLLQWDREDRRNPVSVYVYTGGSRADRWNLTPGRRTAVTACSLLPAMWHGGGHAHQGAGVLFVLEGARDTSHTASGGFFPEFLRSELHGVRKTLEAYALRAAIAGKEEASAAGLLLSKGQGTWPHATFRVVARGATLTYRLDRWD